MTFDSIPVKEKVERNKYLRVEHLVNIQKRPCAVCGDPVVWAGVNAAGKRLPFDPSVLLTNPQKVVISSTEELDVWAMQPPPRRHTCDQTKLQAAADEHERRCAEEVARLKARGHTFRSSRMAMGTDVPDPSSAWGDRP